MHVCFANKRKLLLGENLNLRLLMFVVFGSLGYLLIISELSVGCSAIFFFGIVAVGSFLTFNVQRMSAILQAGGTAKGVVIASRFYRAYWQVEIAYTINGREYKTTNNIVCLRRPVKPGTFVLVKYDRQDPEDGLLPLLFS